MNPQSTISIPESLARSAEQFFGAGTMFFAVGGLFLTALAGLGILYMILILAPGVTERCSDALRQRNILSFAAGALTMIAVMLAGATLRPIPAAAGALLAVTGVLLLVGWASAAEDLGRRLAWLSGSKTSRTSHLASGWLVFVFASLFPILGWFLIFPYVSLSGLGSLVLASFGRSAGAAVPRGRFPHPLEQEPEA